MLKAFPVLASLVFASIAAAQTAPNANLHALSEEIVAKGAVLCPKVVNDERKKRCENIFGHLSLAATSTELRAGLRSSSTLRDEEIQSDLARTRALYERAIITYSE